MVDLQTRNEKIIEWSLQGVHWGIIATNTGLSKTTIQRIQRENKDRLGETESYKQKKTKVSVDEFQSRIDALSETEKAYLAGLVDGEGSVGLYRTKRTVLTRFNLVTNTYKVLIKYVENLIGKEFTYWANKDKWNRQKCCMIQIQHRTLIRIILPVLIPYMVSKKGRAELVLEFIEQRLGRGQHRITDDQWEIVDRFRKINGGNGKKRIGVREYV